MKTEDSLLCPHEQLPAPIPSRMSQVRSFTSHFFQIHFNVIHPFPRI